MQSQIVLILFTLNFSKILTQNDFSKINMPHKRQPINADIEDTPSPEWIRYQQERFQYQSQKNEPNKSSYREIKTETEVKTHSDFKHKPDKGPRVYGKVETITRHGNNYQQPKEGNERNSNKKEQSTKTNMSTRNAVESPSIQGFINFIKSLKPTWMKNSLFRTDDKIKMLHQFKDSLLKTIEHQFMFLWQDDNLDDNKNHNLNSAARKTNHNARNTHLRYKRGILDESNINFPPETALISISFLTFSVFLIKLVLQVVNIIKSKHYQLTSLNMMNMDAIRKG